MLVVGMYAVVPLKGIMWEQEGFWVHALSFGTEWWEFQLSFPKYGICPCSLALVRTEWDNGLVVSGAWGVYGVPLLKLLHWFLIGCQARIRGLPMKFNDLGLWHLVDNENSICAINLEYWLVIYCISRPSQEWCLSLECNRWVYWFLFPLDLVFIFS